MAKSVKRAAKKSAPRTKGKKVPARAARAGRATAKGLQRVAAAVQSLGATPEFAVEAGGCLDQAVATELVFSCTGVGPVPPGTKLGQLFASPVQRQGFCGCVFNKARMAGSAVGSGDIPCQPSTTIGDVIDSLSC